MIKITSRAFSTSKNHLTKSSIKSVYKPHYLNEGTKSFDKNLPYTKTPVKQWEKQNISKDEFFMRKYGSISDEERKRLNEKVDRQRRLRKTRVDASRNDNRENYRLRNDRVSFSQAFKNPLSEYIYGTHSVRAALTANKRELYNKLFIHNNKDEQIIKLAKKYGLKVVKKDSKGELNMISDNGVHNGVILETKPLILPIIEDLGECDVESGEYNVTIFNELYNTEVDVKKTVVRKFSDPSQKKFPLGIYLDGITDPQNIGAIIRSAYFLGADFIVVPEHASAKLGPVASKSSAGSIDLMTIYQTDDSFKFIESIKKNGWNVISTSSKPNEEEMLDLKNRHLKVEYHLLKKFIELSDLAGILAESPILLVMGSEGEGVRTNLKIKSDFLVGLDKARVEQDDIVDSLNVSVASALIINKCIE